MEKCEAVLTKSECVETWDIIVARPILGQVRIYEQGQGVKRSMVTVAGELSSGACKIYGKGCAGAAEVGTTESMYSGTPYKISTVRCLE